MSENVGDIENGRGTVRIRNLRPSGPKPEARYQGLAAMPRRQTLMDGGMLLRIRKLTEGLQPSCRHVQRPGCTYNYRSASLSRNRQK